MCQPPSPRNWCPSPKAWTRGKVPWGANDPPKWSSLLFGTDNHPCAADTEDPETSHHDTFRGVGAKFFRWVPEFEGIFFQQRWDCGGLGVGIISYVYHITPNYSHAAIQPQHDMISCHISTHHMQYHHIISHHGVASLALFQNNSITFFLENSSVTAPGVGWPLWNRKENYRRSGWPPGPYLPWPHGELAKAMAPFRYFGFGLSVCGWRAWTCAVMRWGGAFIVFIFVPILRLRDIVIFWFVIKWYLLYTTLHYVIQCYVLFKGYFWLSFIYCVFMYLRSVYISFWFDLFLLFSLGWFHFCGSILGGGHAGQIYGIV